jgi:hypothetical protein
MTNFCDHEKEIAALEEEINRLRKSIREYFYESGLAQKYCWAGYLGENGYEEVYLNGVTADLKKERADKARRAEIETVVREVLKEKEGETDEK